MTDRETLNQSRPEVREGQVWRDNDPREDGNRKVRVLRVFSTVGRWYAEVETIHVLARRNGHRSRIRLDRFNPNRRDGYMLIEEAPDA